MIKLDQDMLNQFEVRQGSEIIMRLGIGMTLFFPRPFSEAREAVLANWEEFQRLAGPDRFTWARLGGGNKSRVFDAGARKTIEEWLKGKKNYGDTCWISVHDGPMDSIGQWAFVLTGHESPASDPDTDACQLQVVIPMDVLQRDGADIVAGTFLSMASHFPALLAGTAGFIFHRSPYKFNALIEQMGALSRRFQVVEITAARQLAYLAPLGVPTVNWLTFIGQQHLDRLGGAQALRTALGARFDLRDLPGGLAIRAGKQPGLGDRHSSDNDELFLLRDLSECIHAIQSFDLPLELHGLKFDEDRTAEYLQRFIR